jgi:Acetyltransferase (GNAT) domain
MIGYQDERAYYYIDVAFDADWGRHSVGTVLQYLVLEDLFEERTPAVFDFCGGHGEHKVFFENDHYLGIDLLLFPRRLYPQLAQTAFASSRLATTTVSTMLKRYDLKARVKRGVRRASVMLGVGAE